MNPEFSFDLPAISGAAAVRTGKVSEVGDYPDKDIAFSESDFDKAVAGFAPVPMDYEHVPGPLDGHLGKLLKVWRQGKELFGSFEVPAWLQAIFTGNDMTPKVSLTWDRESKRIVKCAWVEFPRVEDAVLMAAFATAEEGSKPAEGDTPPASLSPPPAARKAPMKDLKEFLGNMAAFFTQAAKDAPEETGGEGKAEKPAAVTPAPAPVTAPPVADMSKNPEYIAMTKRVAELETLNLRNAAAMWAEGEIQENRALPKDKERMISTFCQAAKDDAASPATVAFSNADGTAASGSRVDALKADYAARPRHLMTGEFMPDGTEAFAMPQTTAKMSAEEEVMRLLERTPMGKTALKGIKAGDIPDPYAKNGKGSGN